MSSPVVSIIAVCFNQSPWVRQTLDSIKAQTYSNIQLIIADDGSADSSKQIIQQWIAENKNDAVFISHKKNIGLTKNINSALPYIKGEYYQVFGCDDIMMPNKIASQVEQLQKHPEAAIIYSDMILIDAEGIRYPETYYAKHSYKKPGSGWLYEDIIERSIISAPAVLISTSVLQQIGNYNEKISAEDYDFFLRASKLFQFLYTDDVTVAYRVMNQTMSNNMPALKRFKDLFYVCISNYDTRKPYNEKFLKRLMFCTKNLYGVRYKYCSVYFLKAFFKTFHFAFIKYAAASIPFLFTGNAK